MHRKRKNEDQTLSQWNASAFISDETSGPFTVVALGSHMWTERSRIIFATCEVWREVPQTINALLKEENEMWEWTDEETENEGLGHIPDNRKYLCSPEPSEANMLRHWIEQEISNSSRNDSRTNGFLKAFDFQNCQYVSLLEQSFGNREFASDNGYVNGRACLCCAVVYGHVTNISHVDSPDDSPSVQSFFSSQDIFAPEGVIFLLLANFCSDVIQIIKDYSGPRFFVGFGACNFDFLKFISVMSQSHLAVVVRRNRLGKIKNHPMILGCGEIFYAHAPCKV